MVGETSYWIWVVFIESDIAFTIILIIHLFIKQQSLHSITSNLLFSVTTLCTTSLTPLFLDCPHVSNPVPFLSLFCLGWKVRLLGCSPLSAANELSCSKISVSNPSQLPPKVPWKEVDNEINDGPDPPATEASNRSLCCTNNVRLQLRLEVQRFSTAHPYMLTSVNFNNLVT